MSQCQKIMRDMERSKRGITTMDAFKRHGITRLAARIRDLRDMGIAIRREMITTANGARVARYTLSR